MNWLHVDLCLVVISRQDTRKDRHLKQHFIDDMTFLKVVLNERDEFENKILTDMEFQRDLNQTQGIV